MGLLEGKVAVITGAARGQGRAHAIRFAEEGADLIVMDICRDVDTVPYPGARPEDLEATVAAVTELGRRVVASKTDVRDRDAVAAAIDRGVAELGRLDIVVANAGHHLLHPPAEKMTEEAWQTVIDINLTGVWRVVRAALPHLIESGEGGAIVLTSSSAAHIGLPNLNHYSAAKAGVVGLMQSLAVELGPHMIRVNTLHPTTVKTPMALNQATYDLFLPGAGPLGGLPGGRAAGGRGVQGPQLDADPVGRAGGHRERRRSSSRSEQGRYISGTQLRVDAGSAVR